jgi:hypothetical protein
VLHPGIQYLPSQYGSKGYQQEAAIVAAILQLGFDPKRLPSNKGGTVGVKSKVRHASNKNSLFDGLKTFDKAWDRLRAAGIIKDA